MVAGCHWQHPASTGSGAGTFSAASDDNADQTRKQHMQTQIQTFALSVDPFAIHTSFANPVQLIVSLAAKTICEL
ncbi:hypothetical protein PR003_g14124 [Phytophthora rubi]|uniref:Uncharacterized protein n=1 Tax=Phytophthora rubi TaxID=129364 RepID=A0A6A3GDK7_9STRA|nr:hypothetical protein PR002_g32804 [Phytophthora rubi]KAE8952028.1 hypothetical protein PR001_g33470 [Phytophthora rubi]KAE9333224.1 hypothetical protein PR003_g14124 [Phytophthora rubi]